MGSMNFSRTKPRWMQPTGQPAQAALRSSVFSANFSPLISTAEGSLVRCRLRKGSALSSFSTTTFSAVPRLWYLCIISVAGQQAVDVLEKLGVVLALGQREGAVPLDGDALEVFHAHDGAGAEAAEVAVGVDDDAGHGRAGLARRSDAQDAAVPGAGEHAAEELARGVDVEAAHEVHVFELPCGGSRRTGS